MIGCRLEVIGALRGMAFFVVPGMILFVVSMLDVWEGLRYVGTVVCKALDGECVN